MSRIDDYRLAKQEHEFLCGILRKSAEQGNQHIHYAKLDDIYHLVAFSFCSKSGNSHEYQKSERLADFIGKACERFKVQILEMAQILSEKDLLEVKERARSEAQKVLDTIKQVEE